MGHPRTRRDPPPRLELRFAGNVGLLLLLNIVPIAGITYILAHPGAARRVIREGTGPPFLFLLFSSACLLVCAWVLVPTATWLQRAALWRFRHGSSLAWALPLLAASCIRLAATILSLAVLAVLLLGFAHLCRTALRLL